MNDMLLFCNISELLIFLVFKYMDPVIGASSSFQERLADINQHELETIKWEEAKNGRKKTVSSS